MSLGFTSLKKRKDFLRLRNNCSSLKTKNFIFNYKKDQSVSEPIVGITISNKVGNSVKRNYIKRLIRSIISSNKKKFPQKIIIEIIAKRDINPSFLNFNKDFLIFNDNFFTR
tara:strand:+ start:353 stop:688 length:336 start_codon:yes stop_codon:yes gene_type:complete